MKQVPLIELRPATADDAPAMAHIHVDAWQVAYRGVVPDSFLQGFTHELRIGRQVMAEAETMLKSRDYEQAVLWVLEGNEQARRFYEALSFALDGESKDLDFGRRLKAVRYAKTL